MGPDPVRGCVGVGVWVKLCVLMLNYVHVCNRVCVESCGIVSNRVQSVCNRVCVRVCVRESLCVCVCVGAFSQQSYFGQSCCWHEAGFLLPFCCWYLFFRVFRGTENRRIG